MRLAKFAVELQPHFVLQHMKITLLSRAENLVRQQSSKWSLYRKQMRICVAVQSLLCWCSGMAKSFLGAMVVTISVCRGAGSSASIHEVISFIHPDTFVFPPKLQKMNQMRKFSWDIKIRLKGFPSFFAFLCTSRMSRPFCNAIQTFRSAQTTFQLSRHTPRKTSLIKSQQQKMLL